MTRALVRVTVVTDRGTARPVNEDTVCVAGWVLIAEQAPAVSLVLESPVEVLVADGMGGHADGRRASRIAVEGFLAASGSVRDRIASADRSVREDARTGGGTRGMGSTLVGVQIDRDGRAEVFGVGDSRAYRVLDGYLGRLTRDDRAPGTSALTEYIGRGDVSPEPSFFADLLPGDRLLLCSDGVHDVLTEDRIGELIATGPLEGLRDAVLAAGAPDNLTAVVIDLLPGDGEERA